MGLSLRLVALCYAVEMVVGKVVTVSEGLCSTNLPAPSYGWVSTNGSTVPYTFPPTSTATLPASSSEAHSSTSLPKVVTGTVTPIPDTSTSSVSSSGLVPPAYSETAVVPPVSSKTSAPTLSASFPVESPSTSVRQTLTGTVTPIPETSTSSTLSSYTASLVYSETAVVPPVYSETAVVSSSTPIVTPVYSETAVVVPSSSSTPLVASAYSETAVSSTTSIVSYPETPVPTSTLAAYSETPSSTDQLNPTSSDAPIVAPTPSSTAACVQTAPEGAAITCPDDDGLTYCSNEENFGLKCGVQYDLTTVKGPYYTFDPETCLANCTTTSGCDAIQWDYTTNDCTLSSGLSDSTASVSLYLYFMYNRADITDDSLPTDICPFGGCTAK